MGASHSQAHQLQPSPGHGPPGSRSHWAHSFPRDLRRSASNGAADPLAMGHPPPGHLPPGGGGHGRHLPPHCKVLPALGPGPRLHRTENGDILHSGGTISGRRQPDDHIIKAPERGLYRARSQSHHRRPQNGYASGPERDHGSRGLTQFGSEPDLRFPSSKERDRGSRDPSRDRDHYSRDQFRDHRDDSPAKLRISRSRKKYKAPAPPPGTFGMDSSSPDSYQWELGEGGDARTPTRRNRLFKTRAETKRNAHAPSPNPPGGHPHPPVGHPHPPPRGRNRDPSPSPTPRRRHSAGHPTHPVTLQRSLSTPEFQAELLAVARKLRPGRQPDRRGEREGPVGEDGGNGMDNRPLSPKPRGQSAENALRAERNHRRKSDDVGAGPPRPRGEGSGRESPGGVKHWEILPNSNSKSNDRREVPARTFYFGMSREDVLDATGASPASREADRERRSAEIDRFAAEIRRVTPAASASAPTNTTTSGSASLSSEDRDEENPGGIALQLRPTLPKKRLEIPRFSPTAAWRLLSALDCPSLAPSSPLYPLPLDDTADEFEERIQRLSRPTAPLPPPPQAIVAVPRGSHDKSGDSGISGDASPIGGNEDSSEAAPCLQARKVVHQASKALVAAWTPQQDLEGEEESSSDGGLESPVSPSSRLPPHSQHRSPGPAKFSPRSQLFSLSLPRDNQLSQYSNGDVAALSPPDEPSFHSLRNVKRSIWSRDDRDRPPREDAESGRPLDGNWLLSRSVPSSLNLQGPETWRHSSGSPSSPDQDDDLFRENSVLKQPSFSYLATGGHVMYLPDFASKRFNDRDGRERPRSADIGGRFSSREKTINNRSREMSNGHHRSNGNVNAGEMRELGGSAPPSPETPASFPEVRKGVDRKLRPKRFTFQSTLRQIERRRIAERLSRDAELKEQQRLSEVEAMRRVEEEFQRKRAREKANIRHQLRLFNLEEHDASSYNSLPVDWNGHSELDKSDRGWDRQERANHRAEPDGAPATATGKVNGDIKAPGVQVLSEYRQNQREYREYRPMRIADSSDVPDAPSPRRATVHPEAVFDMPKNTPVYVATNHHTNSTPVSVLLESERTGGVSTPRSSSSDNYRRDFAHGAIPASGRSLASSDSEMSQPNTRPTSRQGHGQHSTPYRPGPLPHLQQRSRSASPEGTRSTPNKSTDTSSENPEVNTDPENIPVLKINVEITCLEDTSVNEHNPGHSKHQCISSDMVISNSPTDPPSDSQEIRSPQESTEHPSSNPDTSSSVEVDSSSLEASPKKVSTPLLSVQPFVRNKNKGFRPIVFNPANNQVPQPVI